METKHVLVKDLYRNTASYVDSTMEVSGWVRTIRDSKNFGFIELNDGSFFKNIQKNVFSFEEDNLNQLD